MENSCDLKHYRTYEEWLSSCCFDAYSDLFIDAIARVGEQNDLCSVRIEKVGFGTIYYRYCCDRSDSVNGPVCAAGFINVAKVKSLSIHDSDQSVTFHLGDIDVTIMNVRTDYFVIWYRQRFEHIL